MSGIYHQIDFLTGKKKRAVVTVKSHGNPLPAAIEIGGKLISYGDFCDIVKYFMTNVPIQGPDDPRIELITFTKNLTKKRVFKNDPCDKSMRLIDKRLET